MKTLRIQTSWGAIVLTLDGDQVVQCALPRLARTPRRPFAVEGFRSLHELTTSFAAAMPEGTDFQRAVWKELRRIPAGQTRTYGDIARRIGRPRAARAVGSACGANPLPLFIPCHRAVGAHGRPGGFSAGLPWKHLLLNSESHAGAEPSL